MKNLTFKRSYRNYLTFLSGLAQLTNREIDFLDAFYSIDGEIIDGDIRNQISDRLGVLPKTINLMVKTMYKKNILEKLEHGVYTVNPILKEIQDLKVVWQKT